VSAVFRASSTLDEVRIVVQLARDLEVLSATACGELSSLSGEIGTQIGGLKKYWGNREWSCERQRSDESS